MKRVLGLINLFENEDLLRELTQSRPLAAIPFAGRYRVIDFILSNMVNSGIRNVGILAYSNYRSLMDHLRSGKEWDLARKRDGLFILPSNQAPGRIRSGEGDIEQMYSHFEYFKRSKEQYVLIAGSSMIANIQFNGMLDFHRQTGADVTVLFQPGCQLEGQDYRHCTFIKTDADGRVSDAAVSHDPGGDQQMSMRVYLMERKLFMDIVERCMLKGEHSFIKDGLIRNLGQLKIYGYPFQGHVAVINSVFGYYHHSLSLLQPEVRQNLFSRNNPIYTKTKDEAPTNYRLGAKASNSLVANGCVIEGTVENSILFRGVHIRPGASVRNCVIMQKCDIGPGVSLDTVICDKDVKIGPGRTIKGEIAYPIIIRKGTVI
ncbi:glucose-1-phosphate adenylyltransferase [Anaerosporomusa subterranea]|uniref:Glucose-1-phosphate adenylyltransferase n=1 Tax=Anaerosporomusa subterranea TaxID=1794912 RepID=A0A154BQH9_ANASB|nr:glucose-1-phosphate adenylyltransferase subunit GlgD [Anaerosporomusa subterranea]KYZ76202.1 glucose-1-phosphate adenylyltransferase [Anaerosporomusa subterranea]